MMKISVTQDHILLGDNECSVGCPIWMAVEERMHPSWCAIVLGYNVVFNTNGACIAATLPRSARDFIRCFDEGEPVEPFEFELPETWRIFE